MRSRVSTPLDSVCRVPVTASRSIGASCRAPSKGAYSLFASYCIEGTPSRFAGGCCVDLEGGVFDVPYVSRNPAGETERIESRIFLKFSKKQFFLWCFVKKSYLCYIRREIKFQFYEITCDNSKGNGNSVNGICFLEREIITSLSRLYGSFGEIRFIFALKHCI